jgi:hypothetical protein
MDPAGELRVSSLAEHRRALRDALDGNVKVTINGQEFDPALYSVVPEAVAPPCLIVGPADPYVDPWAENTALGESQLNYVVIVTASQGVNEVTADQVDEMLTGSLRALAALDDFTVEQVDAPGKVSLNGQSYLGAVIRLFTYAQLMED